MSQLATVYHSVFIYELSYWKWLKLEQLHGVGYSLDAMQLAIMSASLLSVPRKTSVSHIHRRLIGFKLWQGFHVIWWCCIFHTSTTASMIHVPFSVKVSILLLTLNQTFRQALSLILGREPITLQISFLTAPTFKFLSKCCCKPNVLVSVANSWVLLPPSQLAKIAASLEGHTNCINSWLVSFPPRVPPPLAGSAGLVVTPLAGLGPCQCF